MIETLVTVEWLNRHLIQPELVVLQSTLKPVTPVNGVNLEMHIPGARNFDIENNFSDRKSSLPHMMPSAEEFTREARRLGIRKDSVIVIYDRQGIYSSPRARRMFQAMGHPQVAVLDGGLPLWTKKNLPVETAARETHLEGDFTARPQAGYFCDLQAVASTDALLIDARSAARFQGLEKEPRAGLRSGHIAKAKNLPFTDVLKGGQMRTVQELEEIFLSLTGSPYKKLIFSCGSGVTACIPALAAELAGFRHISVYDGSWSEWGSVHP